MHIYLISPSGAVRDKTALRLGVKRLKQLGHDVELDPDALNSEQRFAGDDDARLLAVSRAAASGADVQGFYSTVLVTIQHIFHFRTPPPHKRGSRWQPH